MYGPRAERVRSRIAKLDPELSDDERAAAAATIGADETTRAGQQPVAGYDFTFSVPKSVSALWAVADVHTHAVIVAAHHAAVADVVALMECDVAATRAGFNAIDEAVAQVEVTGLVAAAFDHYDSRAGDPQLHTHVVISNRVRTVRDGRWRSLDGRPLHAAAVASEHYNAPRAQGARTWIPREPCPPPVPPENFHPGGPRPLPGHRHRDARYILIWDEPDLTRVRVRPEPHAAVRLRRSASGAGCAEACAYGESALVAALAVSRVRQ